jgi:predicted dehydrogenase
MSNLLKAAIIGLGHQSNDHISAVLKRKDLQITAICDVDKNKLEEFKISHPELDLNFYDNPSQLLEQETIDFAIVSVPHDKYIDIVEDLCKRQIYFMKEKPLARTLKETKELLKIKGFSRYCYICTQRRHNIVYQKAKELLDKDAIGKPYFFSAIYKLNISNPNEGWRGKEEIAGGGCILDMGYHIIDQLVWFFGLPELVFATKSSMAVSNVPAYTEDTASISFKYSSGLHGSIILSRSGNEKHEEFSIYGSNGNILGSKNELRTQIAKKDGEILVNDESSNMLDKQLEFFVDKVRNKSSFDDILESNYKNMYFIDSCYRSAKQEESIKL